MPVTHFVFYSLVSFNLRQFLSLCILCSWQFKEYSLLILWHASQFVSVYCVLSLVSYQLLCSIFDVVSVNLLVKTVSVSAEFLQCPFSLYKNSTLSGKIP